ncbi:hypothetical protein BKA69DRAFT_705580 [Paraphysoderma sedebokerense]|nr:hypothetical protein BKA69DRAFT_705580 [Paraphysoderma sedebokerense]
MASNSTLKPSRSNTGSSTSPSAPPLFEVSIAHRLILDHVYLNGLHALRRIEIRNLSDYQICVKLRSNLGGQVAFQLTNENLPDFPPSTSSPPHSVISGQGPSYFPSKPKPLKESISHSTLNSVESVISSLSSSSSFPRQPFISASTSPSGITTPSDSGSPPNETSQILKDIEFTTNTVAAATLGAFASEGTFSGTGILSYPFPSHQFNQLFNYVNHIDEVIIDAKSSKKIILAFLADENYDKRSKAGGIGDRDEKKEDDGRRGGGYYGSFDDEETHDYFEINGLLFFYGYKVDKERVLRQESDGGVSSDGNKLSEVQMPPDNAVASQSARKMSSTENQESRETNGWITVEHRKSVATDQSSTVSNDENSVESISGSNRPASSSYTSQRSSISSPAAAQSTVQDSGSMEAPGKQLAAEPTSMKQSESPILADASTLDPGSLSPPVPSMQEVPGATTSSAPRADQQVNIKLRARVCRTILWTDVGSTGISFDDCVVGGTYFKDFTIWNRSEIDLFWLLNTVDLSNSQHEEWLRFTDYDTGEPIDLKPIPSYSHRRIRVTFKPKEVGEFNYDLQLENANDSSNVEIARVHATVRSVLKEESLVVSSGNVLDFGDCCAGVWSRQKLVLKNVSESPLEVHFGSEYAEVVFDLKADEYEETQSQIMPTPEGKLNDGSIPEAIDKLSRIGGRSHSEMSVLSSSLSSRASSPTFSRQTSHSDLQLSNPVSESLAQANAIPSSASRNSYHRRQLSSPNVEDSDSDTAERHRLVSSVQPTFTSVTRLITTADTASSSSSSVFVPGSATSKNVNVPSAGEFAHIEELVLKPGTERTIQVSYRPEKDSSANEYKAGILTRRSFRINLTYSSTGSSAKEKKAIQCKARTCTSFVEVTPTLVNFGDTDVGTLKSAPIHILNRSELTARVQLSFTSKVLNSYRDEIIIPPKQSIEVKIDIYPRKINPDYRKQITVINLLNRDNDSIVEVRSNNIDKQRITFHSLFYRILTPTSTNFIDFGLVILNSFAVRTFTIQNISKKRLILQLSSSLHGEILIYKKKARGVGGSSEVSGTATNPPLSLSDTQSTRNKAIGATVEEGPMESVSVLSNATSPIGTPLLGIDDRKASIFESIADRRPLKKFSTSDSSSLPSLPSVSSNASVKSSSKDDSTPGIPSEYLDLALSKELRKSPRRQHRARTAVKAGAMPQFLKNELQRRRTSERSEFSADNDSAEVLKDDGESKQTFATAPSSSDVSPTSGGTFNEKQSWQNDSSVDLSRSAVFNDTESVRPVLDSVLSSLESMNISALPLFPKQAMEERYVKFLLNLRRELDQSIRDGRLIPVTSSIEIAPDTEENIVLIYTPKGANKPYIQGKSRKQDAKVFVRLMDFDREIQQPQFESLLKGDLAQIPVREFLLRSTLCRSTMELGQKNINFGLLAKHERKEKSIVIRNRSEAPLFYNIRKSGSIASGDVIIMEGKLGVIRGYGKKEVSFLFEPTLPGQFQEKLIVENIHDRENHQVVSLKANIRKPSNFFIESLQLDFGVCMINEICTQPQHITISNTNKQPRVFAIRVDPEEMKTDTFSIIFDFNLVESQNIAGTGMMLDAEIEELIESLEQKLKIAKRKGRKDKVKKITEKIAKLRKGEVDEPGKDKEPADNRTETESAVSVGDNSTIDDVRSEKSVAPDLATETGLPTDNANLDAKSASPPNSNTGSEFPSRRSSWNLKSPSAPISFRTRKTEHSIVFSLDPRSTKQISVNIRPIILDPSILTDSSTQLFPLLFNGKILVHEQKNTDAVKKINFRSLVCFDHSTYIQSLQDKQQTTLQEGIPLPSPRDTLSPNITQLSELESSSVQGSQSLSSPQILSDLGITTKSPVPEVLSSTPSLVPVISPQSKDIKPDMVAMNAREPKAEHLVAKKEVSSLPALHVDTPISDLGKIEVTQRTGYNFVISNRSDKAVEFEIVDCEGDGSTKGQPIFIFDNRKGSLSPRETRRVDFSVLPKFSGRQTHKFTIRRVQTEHDEFIPITISFYALHHEYLRFPRLMDSSTELDLGFCYVDPSKKYAKVVPLAVENVTEEDLFVTASSNLALQVYIFEDERCEKAVNELFMSRHSQRQLYIALQPNLPISPPFVLGNRTISPIEVRTLIGGIKFVISAKLDISLQSSATQLVDPSRSVHLTTQTLKFAALIGQSVLSVSSNYVSLGGTTKLNEDFEGSLMISNMCTRLPAMYRLESSSTDITLLKPDGVLEGYEISESKGSKSKEEFKFKVRSSRYGYFRESILIRNLNFVNAVFEVVVSLFVEPNLLSVRDSLSGSVDGGSAHPAFVLPMLTWEDVYCTLEQDQGAPCIVLQSKGTESVASTYIRKFELQNTTSNRLKVVPRSNRDLSVKFQPDVERHRSSRELDGWLIVGPEIELDPLSSVSVFVECPIPHELPEDDYLTLAAQKKAKIKGTLIFENCESKNALKVFDIEAQYCVSVGECEPTSIDVGKIGYFNRWNDIKFKVSLKNSSPIPYVAQLKAVSAFSVLPPSNSSNSTEIFVPSKVSSEIEVVLKPTLLSDLTAGSKQFTLTFQNLYNPKNSVNVNVMANLTLFELRFDRLINGELALPPLHHPSPDTALPCDTWFTIINSSENDIKFEIGVTLIEDLTPLVKVEVLSRFSNSPLKGTVSLSPNGSIEVRVRAYAREESRINQETPDIVLSSAGLVFGRLWVATKYMEDSPYNVKEEIPLRGSIVEGPTFSLSEKRIEFRSTIYADSDSEESVELEDRVSRRSESDEPTQRETVMITNLSKVHPIQFRTVLMGPAEFPIHDYFRISSLDGKEMGLVAPGETFPLSVELLDSNIGISDDIRLRIEDLQSPSHLSQIVTIGVVSTTERSLPVAESKLSDVTPARPLLAPPLPLPGHLSDESSSPISEDSTEPMYPCITPQILLKGCKKVGGSTLEDTCCRYDLDMGQIDMGASAVTKKLVLENRSRDKVSYRLRTICEFDGTWMTISPTDGTLEASTTQTITLSFTTNVRNVYSTYIIIENVDNPSDNKSIRVAMEVVARQNLRRNNAAAENPHVFDVSVNGINLDEPTLDYSLNYHFLHYENEYTARSIVIYNRESVPLEFQMKSNLHYSDSTELLFSLSRNPVKLFRSLIVQPDSHTRVYLRFRPSPSLAIQKMMENNRADFDPNLVEEKHIEIYINCRLVKDYQQIVHLKALCRFPQMSLSSKSLVFRGNIRAASDEPSFHFDSVEQRLDIKNLFSSTLKLEYMNDTLYFLLEAPSSIVQGKSGTTIVIRPNSEALRKNMDILKREKYIQEFITIYNSNRPSERYWINLRLTLGYMTDFQMLWSKSFHQYDILENKVVRFVKDLNTLPPAIATPVVSSASPETRDPEDLFFQYTYLADQIAYYATSHNSGESFFQLGTLLFSAVLNNSLFKQSPVAVRSNSSPVMDIQKWVRFKTVSC